MKFCAVFLVTVFAIVATAAPVVDVREAAVVDRQYQTTDNRRVRRQSQPFGTQEW